MTIQAKSPIIVEVKNIHNYKSILNNIKEKKRLLNSLGFDVSKFYFIGIIRGIDVGLEEKKAIDRSFLYIDLSNIIILYPDKYNFLGVQLYEVDDKIKKSIKDENKGKKEEKKMEEKQGEIKEGKENKNFGDLLKDMQSKLEEFIKEFHDLKEELIQIKTDISDIKQKQKLHIDQNIK